MKLSYELKRLSARINICICNLVSNLAYGVEEGGNQIHGLHGALLGGGDEEPAP